MPANPPDPLRRLLLRLLTGGALATAVPWPARADGGDDDDEVDDHDNSGPGGGDDDSDSDDDDDGGGGDNSGPGGGDDDAEEDDRDDDGGEPDDSGGSPDGDGPGGVEDNSGGGSGGDRPGTGRRARAVRDVTVFYPDGWIERIEDGTYELIDHHRRRVIARPATPEDFARMIALR